MAVAPTTAASMMLVLVAAVAVPVGSATLTLARVELLVRTP